MAFDESLAARIRDALARKKEHRREEDVRRHRLPAQRQLLVGVWKDSLIVRLGPDEGEEALLEPHVREFDITGRPMKGWVLVEPEGVEDDDQLKGWIERAVKFVRTLPAKEK